MRIDLRGPEIPRIWFRYRALLDGQDVSDRCFLADDTSGEVGLYRMDEGGHFYREPETDAVATEFRTGRVTLLAPVAGEGK